MVIVRLGILAPFGQKAITLTVNAVCFLYPSQIVIVDSDQGLTISYCLTAKDVRSAYLVKRRIVAGQAKYKRTSRYQLVDIGELLEKNEDFEDLPATHTGMGK